MQKIAKVFIITVLFMGMAVPVHAQDVNSTGTPHPHGITSSGLGTTITTQGGAFDITGGTQKGSNLFHSFGKFNLHTGESAVFHDSEITNTIGRVTGGDYSWINGMITSGAENLYLLNPAGVMFGANASLDLAGSFHISTADYLRLGENEKFFAEPMEGEILSVAAPSAFGFLDKNLGGFENLQGLISIEGKGEITEQEWNGNPTGLHVKEGKTISLIGGNIRIDKGTFYKTQRIDEEGIEEATDENGNPIPVMETTDCEDIKAPGGRINISAVTSAGEVIPSETDLAVTSSEKGDITISDKSLIDASGGGSIFIRGGEFVVNDSSIQSKALGVKNAGNAGKLTIEAKNISFDNAYINSRTTGKGNGGEVKLKAGESVSFAGNSHIEVTTDSKEERAGDAGTLLIDTKNISFSDRAYIDSSTSGKGKGGDVTLQADSVSFAGEADAGGSGNIKLTSEYKKEGAGDAGNLLIDAKSISFSDRAYIDSSTSGKGKGGDVTLKAYSVSFAGEKDGRGSSNIKLSTSSEEEAGKAGTLLIEAKNISFKDGAYINSATHGKGKGGDVTLKADSVFFSGESSSDGVSQIHLPTWHEGDDAGNAGNLLIKAKKIFFTGGAYINSATHGKGKGGDVTLRADLVYFAGESNDKDGSDIYLPTKYKGEGAGNAGSLLIKAKNISFTDGAYILSDTFGKGKAGDITLCAEKNICLSNRGKLMGETVGTISGAVRPESTGGSGGEILLKADNIRLTNGAEITAKTSGTGKAGNITLSVKIITVSGEDAKGNVSRIYSGSKSMKAVAGSGGDIMISAEVLSLSDKGEISTSSAETGKAGKIGLNVRELRIDTGSSLSSGAVSSYAFDNISGRDSHILVAGDVVNVENAGDGRSVSYIRTEETVRLTPVYTVADITELKGLSGSHWVLMGDIAEVADAGGGEAARYIYADDVSQPGVWLRFGSDEPAVTVPDMTAIEFSGDEPPPYSSGDIIRVENAGDGKPGIFIYSAPEYQAIRLTRFDAADTAELDELFKTFSLRNGDITKVADAGNGEPSEFVFYNGGWIKFNNVHAVANTPEMDNLIAIHTGSTVKVADAGNGNPETFVYSGRDWVSLNSLHTAKNMTERDSLSVRTGDVVKVLDAGEGKPETFLYADSAWIKFAGAGDAGTVTVDADILSMKNSSSITTSTEGHGNAGNITLNAKHLELDTGASVSSASSSETFGGDAGTITVNATDSVSLTGGSSLTTKAKGAGGGQINVNAGNEIYLLGGKITSSVEHGGGKGGDVTTDSKFVILNHGSVTANAEEGDGGAIFIRSENFVKSVDSAVTATSARGNDGTVKIEAPDLDITSGLMILPSGTIDATQWLQIPCSARSGEDVSRFLIKGRDGVPNPPNDWLPGSLFWLDNHETDENKDR